MSGAPTTAPRDADAAPAATVSVTERSPTAREMVRDLWRQRSAIPRFGARLVIKTYAPTRLGRFWLVARTVLPLFGMALLFGAVLGTPSEGVPYLLFLVVGLIAWRMFERTVFWATRSLDRYRRLWANFPVPMLIVPVSAGGLNVVETFILTIVAAVMIVYFVIVDGTLYLNTGPELLLGVAGLVLAYAFGIGLGLLTAILNSKARDTFFALRYILQLWLVITPVIYPVQQLPEGLRFLATVNPVAPMVELTKYGFLGAAELRPEAIAISCAVTLVVLLLGLYVFARRAPWVWRDFPAYRERRDENVVT